MIRRAGALATLWVSACTCVGAPPPPSEGIVPVELADEEALRMLADWRALPVFREGRYRQQSSEDRRTGEKPEMALWNHDNRDMNNFICAGSEADAPQGRVRFVLDMPSCPEHYVKGLAMARFEGSGRLARLWLTAASIRAAPPDRELVRIYVDDDEKPRVELPLATLLQGGASPLWAPPFGAGSTRRVAWYYPVVFARKLIVTLDRLNGDDLYFHQTAVVIDPSGARHAAPRALALREDARRVLESNVPDAGTVQARKLSLAPGDAQRVQLRGPATIVNARVRLKREELARLASLELAVHWDDAEEPAIQLPLIDLFAARDAPPANSSLALSSSVVGDDIELSLRLPMPFASQSRWSLENKGDLGVDLELVLETLRQVPAGSWGNLYVRLHETDQPTSRHPLARMAGRGRLVGVCMAMQGHGLPSGLPSGGHPMHFLEGDEVGSIDGEPSIGGTGTEDYFNGSFYFEDGPSATPFAQVWGIAPGRVSACRWHVLGDAIDFSTSVELEMEIGPGEPSVIDRYRSVAFLYR